VCYQKKMRDSVLCTLSACVVLCHEGVEQSGLLYLQLFVYCSVTLTSDC